MTESKRPPVEVRRRLLAPAERVFAAFADPVLVAQWLKPSPEVGLSVLAFDFRVGGAYRFAYDVPDVGRMIVNGVFWEIEAPRRIVFSWIIEPPDEHADIPSEVTVAITSRGSECELMIRHDRFERADAEARHAQGWAGALEHLELLMGQREQTMPVDDTLLSSLRAALGSQDVREVKMFGGIGFMLRGNMVVALSDRGLLVRVGPAAAPEALTLKGSSPMVMNGRTMTGYIRVEPSALDARNAGRWVTLGRAFVDTLPPKEKKLAAKHTPTKTKSETNAKVPAKTRTRSKKTP